MGRKQCFQTTSGTWKGLVSLSLRSERMSKLPGNLGQLENLKRLILVAEEPEKGWELLRLRPSECLRQLPGSITSIRNLEELHSFGAGGWGSCPRSRAAEKLKSAIFRDCPRLEGLPESRRAADGSGGARDRGVRRREGQIPPARQLPEPDRAEKSVHRLPAPPGFPLPLSASPVWSLSALGAEPASWQMPLTLHVTYRS